MGKTKVTMNKPIYIGQAILDLSKLVIYEFHYDYMIPKYGKNLKLCYKDTDSLVYLIKIDDFYADIAGDVKERLDTSGYDKTDSRPLPVGFNKKVIGLMKDELGGKIMTELVALRAKLYACRKLDNKEDKKCKGINKCVVKKTISFDDYKNCLLDVKSKSIYRSQLMFRNNKHEIHTLEVTKVALNWDDDSQERWDKHISAWLQLIGLELFTRVYIAKLKSCKRFVTKLNESHNLQDAPFSLSNKYTYSVLVAS